MSAQRDHVCVTSKCVLKVQILRSRRVSFMVPGAIERFEFGEALIEDPAGEHIEVGKIEQRTL